MVVICLAAGLMSVGTIMDLLKMQNMVHNTTLNVAMIVLLVLMLTCVNIFCLITAKSMHISSVVVSGCAII